MIEKILAICDKDLEYVTALVSYINRKEEVPFHAEGFTSVQSLRHFLTKERADLLLIREDLFQLSEDLIFAEQRAAFIERILLYENEKPETEVPSVYKYRSAAGLVKEVIEIYGKERLCGIGGEAQGAGKIYGFFCPSRTIEKNILALAAAQVLSAERRVLYVNLEGCFGLDRLFVERERRDLADLIYLLRQEKSMAEAIAEEFIFTVRGMPCLMPLRAFTDLAAISEEDLCTLVDELMQSRKFEICILDLGPETPGLIPLMDRCEKIWMPMEENMLFAAGFEKFKEVLTAEKTERIINKIQPVPCECQIPKQADRAYFENLIWSDAGDAARAFCGR